eukprot:1023820-Pelagomonas_calceolata.AAC.1
MDIMLAGKDHSQADQPNIMSISSETNLIGDSLGEGTKVGTVEQTEQPNYLAEEGTSAILKDLMDIMLAGEDQPQADQPNSLAEGPPV